MPPRAFLKWHYFFFTQWPGDFWTLGDILYRPGENAQESPVGSKAGSRCAFPLPAAEFCETPRILTVLAQVSVYCLQQDARNSWERSSGPNCSGWGKSSLLRIKYAVNQMSPRDRDSDAYSEMLVYQWYVENVVPHLQDPEILLKYPRLPMDPSLTALNLPLEGLWWIEILWYLDGGKWI